MAVKTAIGIDLGTTNTCVTAWKNGKLEIIPNKQGEYTTPSWVMYKPQETVIGRIAKNSPVKYLKTTTFGIKRIIGRNYYDAVVQKKMQNWIFNIIDESGFPKIELDFDNQKRSIYPEEVSALILMEMKEIAQDYLCEEDITDAVITVPAYFNDHQRQATKDAAKIAGLNVLRLINEPSAAAIAYTFDKQDKKGKNVLVYDLGGGTFDVSIITLEGSNIKVKASHGDTNLGGINFDQRCIEYFINLFEQKHKLTLTNSEKNVLCRRLQNNIETAKHDLASTSTCIIEVDSAYTRMTKREERSIDLYEELSRDLFEHLNNDLFESTIEVVKQCITEAELTIKDIDDVVLVGGSTRIIAIQRKLKQFFGKNLRKDINADQAVARGAGILAATLTGNLNIPLIINDVTPMSLGIEMKNDVMNVLVKRNTQIPTEARRIYASAGENAMRITVFMGDSKTVDKNIKLGSFNLLNLPNNHSVDVIFKLDMNGILTVNATETSSGIHKTMNVTLEKGRLTDQKITHLQNLSNLLLIETKKWNNMKSQREKLESYLLNLKSDVRRKGGKIDTEEKVKILNIIEDTQKWLQSEGAFDIDIISKKFADVKLACTLKYDEIKVGPGNPNDHHVSIVGGLAEPARESRSNIARSSASSSPLMMVILLLLITTIGCLCR